MSEANIENKEVVTLQPRDASILNLLKQYPDVSKQESDALIGLLTDEGKVLVKEFTSQSARNGASGSTLNGAKHLKSVSAAIGSL